MGHACSIGLALGGIGFVAAAVLALAGPFEPVALEQVIADRASTVVDSARALWRGETPPPPPTPRWTVDRWIDVLSVVLAATALAFAALGFARGEAARAVLAVIALGAGAIGFSTPLGAFAIVGVAAVLLLLERQLRAGRSGQQAADGQAAGRAVDGSEPRSITPSD